MNLSIAVIKSLFCADRSFFSKPFILFFFPLLITINACSVNTKNDVNLTPNLEGTFVNANKLTHSEKWWVTFEDAQLSQLISLALENNHSLSATLARTKSSAAILTRASADFYPDLNLATSATSNIEELQSINSASFGLSSSWELDVWGKISALEDKAQWDLINQQASYKAKANTVAGTIATAWVGWLAESEKQRLFTSQYQRTKTALAVINRRFAMGKNSLTDIWQQKRLLESIKAQQTVNNARLAIFKKQLILWLGISSKDFPELLERPLPDISPITEHGLPILALQNRPDIQQAYAKLKSINAALAAAAMEKFPRLTLRANYATSKNSVSDLFDDWSGNLIASLALPIFDAGSIEAKIAQQQFNFDAYYADYKQAWLTAIYSVETTLINDKQLAEVAKQLSIQLSLASKTERVVSLKYLNGKASYIALLRAQETSLKLERQIVDAQKALINNRILFYRELSHGNFSTKYQFDPIPFISEQNALQATETSL